MSLRDKAVAKRAKGDRSKIGAIIAANPDRADEIRDLLLGGDDGDPDNPWIPQGLAADILNEEFDPGQRIAPNDVGTWRRVHR